MKIMSLVVMVMLAVASTAGALDTGDISLPAPRMEGGKPLLQALRARQSTRTFAGKKLPPQLLSDLLWAAAGINRPGSGKRTAPSARNWQEVEVYAVVPEGAYRYDAKANSLRMVARGDFRKLAGTQAYAATVPLNLVYVADSGKMAGVTAPEEQAFYSGADTGFISQNVYLFCASEGLATVVRASVDRTALGAALKLTGRQKITLVQSVGYPEAPERQ
ncbi:SagB/ThcOx family dehydrogenase [Oryzomonas sagensis]|nr:SagB/ThcOx family dehydrogenase [Oryzomonas sagensis]